MKERLSDETILAIFYGVPWPVWFAIVLTVIVCCMYIITNLRVKRDKDTGKITRISFYNRSKQKDNNEMFELLKKIELNLDTVKEQTAKNTEAISFIKEVFLGEKGGNTNVASSSRV